ncbi:membrane protein [Leptolyngbya sp. Heron Island J]|uniref:TM2 domain-containing protein n=1 Tax=Leptolyngbya sp. Heron Island J TaxID=1385935 RepID=UPI0003B93CEA|nr:TM2 domain-containing protein [Leptolyngbya sp. Heron Island J]ESA34157.1 membrane protein [Leptolyngbya sp. Heron Island J]
MDGAFAILRIDRIRDGVSHYWGLGQFMEATQANHQKNRKLVGLLALVGAVQPTPIPFAGIHKFYLGDYGWGIVYMLLGLTPVPRIACAAEGIWYLVGPMCERLWLTMAALSLPANNSPLDQTVENVANSLREIEHLRQEGLLSDHEFEQKRRSLLEQIP